MRDWNWATEYEPEFCMATCVAMENFHPLKDKREEVCFAVWSLWGVATGNDIMRRDLINWFLDKLYFRAGGSEWRSQTCQQWLWPWSNPQQCTEQTRWDLRPGPARPSSSDTTFPSHTLSLLRSQRCRSEGVTFQNTPVGTRDRDTPTKLNVHRVHTHTFFCS